MRAYSISHVHTLSDEPHYNIKAVSQQTDVHVSTLRAWEARYGFPTPHRSHKGHRRYSERDVALVHWLHARTEEGMAISQAVDLLKEKLEARNDQHAVGSESPRLAPASNTPTRVETARAVAYLLDALRDVNFQQAQRLFDEICETYPFEVALLDVFHPLMVEVGNRWLSGELHVTGEQLGTSLLRQWLLSRLQHSPTATQPVRIICGCAPGEHHDMGLLMLGLLMQERGHEVLFLGGNMSLSGLGGLLERLAPAVLCVSVSLIEHIPALLQTNLALSDVTDMGHDVALVCGGRVFEQHPALLAQMPGLFLGNDLQAASRRISALATDLYAGRVGADRVTGWLASAGPVLAEKLDFMKEPICNTVSLNLSREFPELGRVAGPPGDAPWREQIYNETPRRLHRLIQVVLRCASLDVIDQEYRWAWHLLPQYGVLQKHLLTQVEWYFDAVDTLVGLLPEEQESFDAFREAVTERVRRSISEAANPAERAA